MDHLKFGLVLLIFLFFVNCSQEENEIHDDFVIEFGTVCGWCAGNESITVSNSTVNYQRIIPCGENQGTFNNSKMISADLWDDIVASFNYSYFLTLDYNECNVCVDGCDEFILITNNNKTHKITYKPSTQIVGLENLRGKLFVLMNELREQD